MKTIFRNFLRTIRRYKLAVALNILGLSVAFAAFIIIMIQLNYDFGFDKCHRDYDRIFRLEFSRNAEFQTLFTRPFAEQFFESSPYILAGGFTNFSERPVSFHVEKDHKQITYEESSLTVSSSFFDVFSFDFVEGSTDGDIAPESTFIPVSLARRLFNNELAVGKQLVCSDGRLLTVRAVYRDLPAGSSIRNCIYFDIQGENKNEWSNSNYIPYIRVSDPSKAHLIIDNFKRNFEPPRERIAQYNWEDSGTDLRLTALSDLHYITGVRWDNTPKASKQTLLILFAIAIVTVIIAGINFTNFGTSLAPMRVKNINTQRVMGAQKRSLRLSIASETVIISFLSYLFAILFVVLFDNTPLSGLVDFDTTLSRLGNVDLTIAANLMIFAGTALIALITGLLAGLYPAFYMTSFAPALALNSRFGLSSKGIKLRNLLIGVQYVASFALIIGASFMYLQNYFMQRTPLGYDKDTLITTDIRSISDNRDAFTGQLKACPEIEDVTYSYQLLSSMDDGYLGWGRMYNDEPKMLSIFPVHYSFLKVTGIELTEGRDFRQEDEGVGMIICNETARREHGMEIGKAFGGNEIIGFMSDVHFASFRKEVAPMAFIVQRNENANYQPNQAYIKIRGGAGKREAMAYIRSTLADFNPNFTFNVRFYDEVVQGLYEKEIALNALITFFSLIAIFIAIVGVFGLVIFDSECRRKEIGIRKVLGASVAEILFMFNKLYFRLLLICIVIAAPLAWYAVARWLQNFAYKTPLYWWVYLFAFVVVGIITVATITFQSWRVANDNPVNAIKAE